MAISHLVRSLIHKVGRLWNCVLFVTSSFAICDRSQIIIMSTRIRQAAAAFQFTKMQILLLTFLIWWKSDYWSRKEVVALTLVLILLQWMTVSVTTNILMTVSSQDEMTPSKMCDIILTWSSSDNFKKRNQAINWDPLNGTSTEWTGVKKIEKKRKKKKINMLCSERAGHILYC